MRVGEHQQAIRVQSLPPQRGSANGSQHHHHHQRGCYASVWAVLVPSPCLSTSSLRPAGIMDHPSWRLEIKCCQSGLWCPDKTICLFLGSSVSDALLATLSAVSSAFPQVT